jgi:hypothetical protein
MRPDSPQRTFCTTRCVSRHRGLRPCPVHDDFNIDLCQMAQPEQFHVKPAEVRLFLRGALDGESARELSEQMRETGLPVW